MDKNNFHDIESAVFFKWIFKSACAILIVTNTWDIVMGVFDVAQGMVNNASGVIIGDTAIDISSVTADLEARLMEDGPGAAVRPVVPIPLCGHYHVGAGDLHFHYYIRENDLRYIWSRLWPLSPWRP